MQRACSPAQRDRRRVGVSGAPEFAPVDRAYGFLLGVARRDHRAREQVQHRTSGGARRPRSSATRGRVRCGHAGPDATVKQLWYPTREVHDRPNWWLLHETEKSERIEAVVGLRELRAELPGAQVSANRVTASSSSERAREVVAPLGQRGERGGRGVRRGREHARRGRREAAAVEAGGVAEDERRLRADEPCAPPTPGHALEVALGRVVRRRAASTARRRRTARRAGCRRRTGTAPSPRPRRRGRGTPSGGACRCSRGARAGRRPALASFGCGTEYQTSTYSSFDHMRR